MGRSLQRDSDGLHTVKIMEQKNNARVLTVSAIEPALIDDNASNWSLLHQIMGHTN